MSLVLSRAQPKGDQRQQSRAGRIADAAPVAARAGSLFGVHSGSVRIREGVDLPAPALDVGPGAERAKGPDVLNLEQGLLPIAEVADLG